MKRSLPIESEQRRVLFVSPAAQLGGAERCLVDFVWAAQHFPRPVSLTVLCLADGPLVGELERLGARVVVLPLPEELAGMGESELRSALASRALGSALRTGQFLSRFARALRREPYSWIHTNGMKAHVLAGVLAPRTARLAVHLHDFVSSRRLTSRLLPRLNLRAARFIANSRAVAEDFQVLAPRADVRVVYNAIDTVYFSPGAPDGEWLAGQAGLPPSSAVSVGLIATYAHWKGHHLFIEAAKRVAAQLGDTDVRFYIVGGPIYATRGSQVSADELVRHIESAGLQGKVGLVPFQRDVVRVFRSLNVVVHASTQPEPFGRTIVEAMATGRPTVVSNAGGAAELFQHGATALGFLVGNVEDLARQVARLVGSAELRAQLGRNGQAWAAERFSRQRLARDLAPVFDAVG